MFLPPPSEAVQRTRLLDRRILACFIPNWLFLSRRSALALGIGLGGGLGLFFPTIAAAELAIEDSASIYARPRFSITARTGITAKTGLKTAQPLPIQMVAPQQTRFFSVGLNRLASNRNAALSSMGTSRGDRPRFDLTATQGDDHASLFVPKPASQPLLNLATGAVSLSLEPADMIAEAKAQGGLTENFTDALDERTAPVTESLPAPSTDVALPVMPEVSESEGTRILDMLEQNNAGPDGAPSTSSESVETAPVDIEGEEEESTAADEEDAQIDDELGTLRLQQVRSRASEELGILRLLQTAQAEPPAPEPPMVFVIGRLGFFGSENATRNNDRLSEQIYQSGLALYLVPPITENTSLYAIAETNLARYDDVLKPINYNEIEFQLGIRQRLTPNSYAQIGWRNQRLDSPGYRKKLFSVNYIDALISHRYILDSKTWIDGFYQARIGFADPEVASRFRQTLTLSFNHSINRDLRTSLLYQIDFDDYTQAPRYDSYQQVLGIVSYNLTPESRLSLFGGTRFGRSSVPEVNLDDIFYGAGLTVSVPLF